MQSTQIYQLLITLTDSDPAIWRRCQVEASCSLAQLHLILQAVMGWQNAHLHEFRIDGDRYGPPSLTNDEAIQDEQAIGLNQLSLPAKGQFTYFYDFGDGWLHQVLVEAVLSPEQQQTYPVCLAGEQACPPENSGGIWGYEELLERLSDPEDPDYMDLWDWVGGDFDPNAFDLTAANQRLQSA
ncbi:plasmid pRiA4b ORF-3 family protein [Sphaerothrix gracilis]|uniref:plasmid pRiA4b ORF-3 family protein n=1 Tax=Sphaerothrix gracilis TaxID=3151835 RepID=UPI0031FD188B